MPTYAAFDIQLSPVISVCLSAFVLLVSFRRYVASACMSGLRCQPQGVHSREPSSFEPSSLEFAPGLQGNAAPSFRARFRGAQASRFRPIFQVFFAGPPVLFCWGLMPITQALFEATRARNTPLRSGRGGDGASPAAANSAATGSPWPAPSSTIMAPSGASSAGADAAIAR